MSRHRLEPRRAQPRRARPRRVRPRYGRMGAAGLSLIITMVALLAGVGVIPLDGGRGPAYAGSDDAIQPASGSPAASDSSAEPSAAAPTPEEAEKVSTSVRQVSRKADRSSSKALPADSGEGRRVVFAISAQRVWLVDSDEKVLSTYLVSGSVEDNLGPGSYEVYSRSRHAVGIDDSGVMEYFVRFTRGKNAAIGFHSIPSKDGQPLQTEAQLGTPLSHGCIRQRKSDAVRLWDFAPDGTVVVVTA